MCYLVGNTGKVYSAKTIIIEKIPRKNYYSKNGKGCINCIISINTIDTNNNNNTNNTHI